MDRELEEIVKPLLEWFDRNARVLPWRDQPTPYRVWGIGDYAPADPGGSSKALLPEIYESIA